MKILNSIKKSVTRNSAKPAKENQKLRGQLKRQFLEALEDRRLMAGDVTQFVTFDGPVNDDTPAIVAQQSGAAQLNGSPLAQIGGKLDVKIGGKPIENTEAKPEVELKGKITQTRFTGRWHLNLSPAVRSAIESARQLKQANAKELQKAQSWAVVTTNPEAISKRLDTLKLANITDRSDLFRGKLPASVLEVELKDPAEFSMLLKLAPVDGQEVLEVIPLFESRFEATGTLDASTVTDGSFGAQWHLDSTASDTQYGIDAENAWFTATGEGVTLAVVDSRQDVAHPDLSNNNNASLNYDDANLDWDGDGVDDQNPNVFLPGGHPNYPNIADTDTNSDGTLDTDNIRQQSHGTSVAGLALGDDEGTGIVGVAPDATYAAFNFLDIPNGQSQSIPDTFSNANITGIDVFNASWGTNNSRQLRYRSFLEIQAVENAAVDAIFVKSAGNNRDAFGTYQGWDRANYDHLHMRQTLVVGAARQDGRIDRYSNPGSNVLISAPVNQTAGGNSVTADVTDGVGNADNRGYRNGNVNQSFNGTSAAAPMVSGTVALMLEANPGLDWRNVQHILIDTAQKSGLIDSDNDGSVDGGDLNADGTIDNLNLRTTFQTSFDTNGDGLADTNIDTDTDGNADPYHTGWFQNAAGNWVSDSFGFGMIDANMAVRAAVNWTNVESELRVGSQKLSLNNGQVVEGNLGGLNSLSNIASYATESKMKTEWVEVTVNATVADQDDLMLVLRSPSGTQSILMAPGGSSTQSDINNFTFSTNQFWDESSEGTWTLQALDTGVGDGQAATITDWQINIYGSCCDASPLKVTTLAESGMSLESFAELALVSGGLESDMYSFNEVKQIGDSQSMGVFENGAASDLPIDKGLLFTSGKAVDAIGPNDKPNTTTNWKNPGHPLLDNITGTNTRDASGLSIYLTAKNDAVLSYDALFGSEEFDEWVGSVFNDGAGIFVAELKSRDQDFDLGSTTDVLRQPNGGKMTISELANKEANGQVEGKFYNPNPVCGDMNWEYDGSSELTQSEAIELQAGHHYYIGIMVADGVDGLYDSGLALSLDSAATNRLGGDSEKGGLAETKKQVIGTPELGKKLVSKTKFEASSESPENVSKSTKPVAKSSKQPQIKLATKSVASSSAASKSPTAKTDSSDQPGKLVDAVFAETFGGRDGLWL